MCLPGNKGEKDVGVQWIQSFGLAGWKSSWDLLHDNVPMVNTIVCHT